MEKHFMMKPYDENDMILWLAGPDPNDPVGISRYNNFSNDFNFAMLSSVIDYLDDDAITAITVVRGRSIDGLPPCRLDDALSCVKDDINMLVRKYWNSNSKLQELVITKQYMCTLILRVLGGTNRSVRFLMYPQCEADKQDIINKFGTAHSSFDTDDDLFSAINSMGELIGVNASPVGYLKFILSRMDIPYECSTGIINIDEEYNRVADMKGKIILMDPLTKKIELQLLVP